MSLKRSCRGTLAFVLVVALAISACSHKTKLKLVDAPAGRTLKSYSLTTMSGGMIAAPNEQASQIGLSILKKGGNAADAAVAVSFALSVLRPQSTGIGGGGFLLFYNKREEKSVAIDFREFAPAKASRDMYLRGGHPVKNLSAEGALAVAVPRLTAGLGYVYEKYGSKKISWKDLVQPSVDLAAAGFQVYPHLAEAVADKKELLSRFPSSRAVFLDGEIPKVGELFIQKDLAETLRKIAEEGWQAYYHGPIADSIVKTVQKYGGIITPADFENVQPTESTPVEGTYRGYKIVSMPLPSSGGIILIEILNILENEPLYKQKPYDVATLHFVTEAMKRSFLDRAAFLGDPRFVNVPVKGLTNKDYAKSLAEGIKKKKATPSHELSPAPFTLRESNSTTHFSIVDGEGNAVSSTQTVNYTFGSGLVAEGSGIVLNDEMDDFSIQPGVPNVYGLVGNEANAIAPGKIPLSSMSPTLVFDPEGKLNMVLGSPGGPKIITAVLHTILNRLDFKATPLEAVAAKRYHHQWLPDVLKVETGLFPPYLVQKLKGMGHAQEEIDYTGFVMLVAHEKQGWTGVVDPRTTGVPMGL